MERTAFHKVRMQHIGKMNIGSMLQRSAYGARWNARPNIPLSRVQSAACTSLLVRMPASGPAEKRQWARKLK